MDQDMHALLVYVLNERADKTKTSLRIGVDTSGHLLVVYTNHRFYKLILK